MNLAERIQRDEIHVRLINWGSWLRHDSTFSKLGYPSQAPFIFSPSKGVLIADLDAAYIEWIVSTLHMSGFERGLLYAFILKVEYAERSEGKVPHVSQRAKDVSRHFKRPCAERTYYHHLANAKKAVQMLAGPMK